MPLDDIMSMWFSHDQQGMGNTSPTDIDMGPWSAESHHDIPATAENDRENPAEIDGDDDDDELATKFPKLETYRSFILGAPAFQWLIADMEKQFRLMPSMPDAAKTIRERILKTFPSIQHFSRRNPPRSSKVTFFMPWDPVGFCKDQEYKEEVPLALATAVTLTGSTKVAQALTTSQYMRQIWPLSGPDILEVIQEVSLHTPGARVSRSLSDGTIITVWIERHDALQQPTFVAEATGTAYTLAELGEQFAWIGTALRSSQFSGGVAGIQPRIESLHQVNTNNPKAAESGRLAEVICKLTFKASSAPSEQPADYSSNGECWHNLFRNPVLVRGFPIARRSSRIGLATGLEIPLYMMARLADAKVVNSFCGRMVIKGFSTMLVPTHRDDNTIFWHLIHDEHGDRIPYLECLSVIGPRQISSEQMRSARHVLGWCTEAKFLAGTATAKYDVIGARLPRPHDNCLLQHTTMSSGQLIVGGVSYSVGYKDLPFHITRSGYIRKLKWISKKFVVLWDEDSKRGWLINGTSALLHLVRASLEHDSKDKFSSEFLFQIDDLQEAPLHAAYKSDSAIGVLLNRANRSLKIYAEKDGNVLFEDRVEHYFRLLEQAMDHQVNVSGSYANAQNRSANVSRAYLEGWDFHDLVTDLDPVYPRVADLSKFGMGWIEFARSLHAVTLVGREFGEILTPAKQPCPQWAALPTDKYYLAVSATDLIDIMDAFGDATAAPPRLTDGLAWLKAEAKVSGADCMCADRDVEEHIDITQVILPLDLIDKSKPCQPHQLEDGAVIFGYNERIPWFWRETGDPVYGIMNHSSSAKLGISSPPSDSGYGPSTEEESTSNSIQMQPTTLLVSVPSDTSVIPMRISPSLSRRVVESGLGALNVNAYRVGVVCALPLELLAVRALFDVTHADGKGIATPPNDFNHYALGEIGKHKVVAACLPDGEYGTNSAADVATNMRRTFTSVKVALLIGIGGGVPSPANDIRLGDVVVSKPTSTGPSVIQYDMGKVLDDGDFTQGGFLQAPPRLIMTALSSLRSDPHLSAAPLQDSLDEIAACRREYRYPGRHLDRFFHSDHLHDARQATSTTTCDRCDLTQLQPRPPRLDTTSGSNNNVNHPRIHYGTIASGNRVVRDSKFRDHWGAQSNILCFEMEAAGIMNTIPSLVIRGICDYADSHKNKDFQHYAAAAAASYAKLLLSYVKDLRDLDMAAQVAVPEGQNAERDTENGKRKTSKSLGLRQAFRRANLRFLGR
ncbi:hypothetical protein BDV06DRAFT_22677 [Aspergillus oleicola]